MMQSFFRLYPNFKLTKNLGIILITCAAILAITISVANVNIFKNSRAPTWKNIPDNVPSSVIKKVLSTDVIRQVDENSIKVMQIPSSGAGTLYIFDFRSPKLCGTFGCFYQVYHESGQLFWQFRCS
jgi:hypothetical protein